MTTDTFETGTGHLYTGADGQQWVFPTKRWDIRHINHQTDLKAVVLIQMTRSERAITVRNKDELHNALTAASKEMLASPIWLEGEDFSPWIGRIGHPLDATPEQLREAVMDDIASSLCLDLQYLLNMDTVVGEYEWTFTSMSPRYHGKQPQNVGVKADCYGREIFMHWHMINDGVETLIIRMPGMLPLQVGIRQV